MEYRALTFECSCGVKPHSVRIFGLTALGELIIIWKCSGCQAHACVRYSLEQLSKMVPTQDPFSADDLKLLKEMHIEVQHEAL